MRVDLREMDRKLLCDAPSCAPCDTVASPNLCRYAHPPNSKADTSWPRYGAIHLRRDSWLCSNSMGTSECAAGRSKEQISCKKRRSTFLDLWPRRTNAGRYSRLWFHCHDHDLSSVSYYRCHGESSTNVFRAVHQTRRRSSGDFQLSWSTPRGYIVAIFRIIEDGKMRTTWQSSRIQ